MTILVKKYTSVGSSTDTVDVNQLEWLATILYAIHFFVKCAFYCGKTPFLNSNFHMYGKNKRMLLSILCSVLQKYNFCLHTCTPNPCKYNSHYYRESRVSDANTFQEVSGLGQFLFRSCTNIRQHHYYQLYRAFCALHAWSADTFRNLVGVWMSNT